VIDGRNVLALITARGGSKGVPGKNILTIGGKPLLQWTIDAARGSRYVDRVVLSSDDAAIIAVARDGGCEVPFVRPAALATDSASSMDVVLDALDRLQFSGLLVLLQPTSPLRTAADIDGALELLVSRGAPACVSVREAEDHPYWTFMSDADGRLRRFAAPEGALPSRRQDLPAAWCLNGAVYVADSDSLRRERSFVVPDTVGFAMPVDRSLDIDTPDDVARFRRILGESDKVIR
jgi:CMP-N,N'-diacetyllegionaminic acid synthase